MVLWQWASWVQKTSCRMCSVLLLGHSNTLHSHKTHSKTDPALQCNVIQKTFPAVGICIEIWPTFRSKFQEFYLIHIVKWVEKSNRVTSVQHCVLLWRWSLVAITDRLQQRLFSYLTGPAVVKERERERDCWKKKIFWIHTWVIIIFFFFLDGHSFLSKFFVFRIFRKDEFPLFYDSYHCSCDLCPKGGTGWMHLCSVFFILMAMTQDVYVGVRMPSAHSFKMPLTLLGWADCDLMCTLYETSWWVSWLPLPLITQPQPQERVTFANVLLIECSPGVMI